MGGHGTKPAGEFMFLYGRRNENHEIATVFYIREPYQQLRS
jgi:hypothetical protein